MHFCAAAGAIFKALKLLPVLLSCFVLTINGEKERKKVCRWRESAGALFCKNAISEIMLIALTILKNCRVQPPSANMIALKYGAIWKHGAKLKSSMRKQPWCSLF